MNSKRNLKLATCFLSIILLASQAIFAREDYAAYAKEQQEKAQTLITLHKTEIQEIIKQVDKRQQEPDIQSVKQEMISVAKGQCLVKDTGNFKANKVQAAGSTPILIFVSFSMPKESIKGWINQARKINAAVYIRGLVNNSFKDTTLAVHELVKEQPGGLLIDPTLFKKYAVTQVPAVVVTSGNDFDVIYGDVTLDYALKKINDVTGSRNNFLLDAISKLKKLNGIS